MEDFKRIAVTLMIACVVVATLLLSGCSDTSRNFVIEIHADEDSWVEVAIDRVRVDKEGNTEEANNSPKADVEVPLVGGTL